MQSCTWKEVHRLGQTGRQDCAHSGRGTTKEPATWHELEEDRGRPADQREEDFLSQRDRDPIDRLQLPRKPSTDPSSSEAFAEYFGGCKSPSPLTLSLVARLVVTVKIGTRKRAGSGAGSCQGSSC